MDTTLTNPLQPVYFRPEPRKGHTVKSPAVHSMPDTSEADAGEFLACRRCLSLVTVGAERIEIHGAHAHSFTNPHGLFFDIGCFRHAPGCSCASEASSEFTWFAGFRWHIAVCRSCMEHLGWLFSSGGSRFYGLILDKIISVQSGPSPHKRDA